MGLKDLLGKVTGKKEEEKKPEQASPEAPKGKYTEVCALCGQGGTDTKWMGQYWHKKCKRRSKKLAKGMI
jgi:hypothetical protein